MTQPNPSGEYSVRSLAEILREHGLESELGTRPGRRRKSSDDTGATGRSARVDTGSGQPLAEPPGRSPSAAPNGRAATPPRSPARAPERAAPVPVWTPAPEPTARPAAGLLSPQPPVAAPAPARPAAGPADAAAPPAVRPGRRKSDATPTGPGGEPLFGTGPSTAAIPAASPTTAHTAAPTTAKPTSSTGAGTRGATGATARGATGAARRGIDHPVTGPIPVVSQAQAEAARGAAAKADEEPLTGRESVLAWARFAGEMVVALAAGIGVYFAFTVLWELLPYVALVAAPVTVTGLVAGVAAYRQRRGQGPLPVRLLAVLLLAGTVLVIAPAAGLLASS
ncbi:hypothetical protein O2W18_14095 [Modestobacter sp. VKM Ac-2983]|uniref:hypothetical protein n=1 Tax=Modestobacter sp. VKM Ac-2983 TaxID=3004137 RepID=UPI0022ABAD8F|nr:hypothetical protein [Modestobacter sp. VKM Ac-2983]MCZ2806243.1 hypothetical protein [Modestobacter sp. VKM Ac-2983]